MDEELTYANTRMTIDKEEGEKIEEDEGIEEDKDEETDMMNIGMRYATRKERLKET